MTNLKYYLRGLGIGVVVTALIMSIMAGREKEALSNEEIIERARALGMTEESTVLADTLISNEQDETEGDKEPPLDGQAENLPGVEPESANTGEAGVVSEPSETENMEQAAAPQETEEAGQRAEPEAQESEPEAASEKEEENFTIEIKSGDSSYSICQKLEDAGLVETATAFDRFLFENGYDKRINTGTFEIPMGADMEQIARILARMK